MPAASKHALACVCAVPEKSFTDLAPASQQKIVDDEKARLTALKEDDSLSSMKKAKASNELAQLNAKDPLPLDRARINQGAAVRKQKKAEKDEDKKAETETDPVQNKLTDIVAEVKKQGERRNAYLNLAFTEPMDNSFLSEKIWMYVCNNYWESSGQ